MKENKELWKVFYINGKEVMSYTVFGTFPGEQEATIKDLTYEYNAKENEIEVKKEWR